MMADTTRCPNDLIRADRLSPWCASAIALNASTLIAIPRTVLNLALMLAVMAISCGSAWQRLQLNAAEQQPPGAGAPSVASAQATGNSGKTGPSKSSKAPPRKRPRYERRAVHDPNGIGKFYMGREIAHVMGAAAISWLERPEREQEENIAELINALDLKPGQVVADIGAGSGRITLLMAEKVGSEGKVLAVDVQRAMLEALEFKLKKNKVENVELILGKTADPRLPAESCDLAIMVDVYHEFEFPYEMIQKIARGIRPGGRVVFVEFRMEDPEVPIKLVHKMSVEQVRKEMDQPGIPLKFKEVLDNLPWQHIIVFEKVVESNAATPAGAKENDTAAEKEKDASEEQELPRETSEPGTEAPEQGGENPGQEQDQPETPPEP